MREPIADPGVPELRVGDGRRRVREGDDGGGGTAEPLERGEDVVMRRQAGHLLCDRGRIGIRQRHAPTRGKYPQGAPLRGGEVDVLAGDRADEGELEHLREPQRPDRRVPEDADEVRIEGAQVEERLIHVERDDPWHCHSAERAGFEPARLSPTRFPGERTRPLCDLSVDPCLTALPLRGCFARGGPAARSGGARPRLDPCVT